VNLPAPVSTALAILGYLGTWATAIVGAVNAGNWGSAEQVTITTAGAIGALITHALVTHKTTHVAPPTSKAA